MEGNDLIIKLSKPYKFDGETYETLDLTPIEDATGDDLRKAAKLLSKKEPGQNPATLEMTMDYAFIMAARACKKPLEFFDGLPAKDAVAVKTAVVGFLYAGDGDN